MVQYNLESNITNEPNLICAFTERLDTANCLEIEDELINKVRESKAPVIFNLQDVDYVASAFLRMCLKVAKEVGPENFSVINVHPNVKKVFKIAGFDKQISIT
ncbi:MAG: STAS domain-containing protein [Candidatus Omnitrophica bacterium]|nr:STAS domain-containing protein [Candidatus Omnitrophota bacterium]